MKRRLFIALWLVATAALGQTWQPLGSTADLAADRNLAGCNYTSYLNLNAHLTRIGATALTPPPAGYEAFYISTYARHGSRFMLLKEQYDAPIAVLADAERSQLLTAKGQALLSELRSLRSFCTDERLGTLTETGQAQHRAIAERLCATYPEVFDATADVQALSSKSPRCVQSMATECSVIASATGRIVPQTYNVGNMQERLAGAYSNAEMKALEDLHKAYHERDLDSRIPYEAFCAPLFVRLNPAGAERLKAFTRDVFHLAQNMQSHTLGIDLWGYFEPEAVVQLSAIDNRYWYRRLGPSPVTGSLMPQRARPQLEDILAAADSIAERRHWHGAHLRFGHDMCLLPLACLMQLGTCATVVPETDIERLDQVWRCQEIFPMAGNIQLVFYRSTAPDAPVLVKALLNEREVTLPIDGAQAPYYPWPAVRALWQNALQ